MTIATQSHNIIVDREDLVKRAYKAAGYRGRDYLVINDSMNALRKKSDAQLLEIINKAYK